MLLMKSDDRLLLPRCQPEIPGNPTVVLIDSPIALSPVVELAGPHSQPADESSDADFGPLRPASDEIYDQIPHVMRHPNLRQSSPRLFFKAMCSAISSANTSSLVWIFFSRTQFVVVRRDSSGGPCPGMQQRRSRRTLFANGRIPLAATPVPHIDPKPALYPTGAVSGLRPSRPSCSAFALFACVLSVILTEERSLQFQLRRDSCCRRSLLGCQSYGH